MSLNFEMSPEAQRKSAQRDLTSAPMSLIETLRTSHRIVLSLVGVVQTSSMKERATNTAAEYAEQIRILEAITPEAHDDYMKELLS